MGVLLFLGGIQRLSYDCAGLCVYMLVQVPRRVMHFYRGGAMEHKLLTEVSNGKKCSPHGQHGA